MPMRFVLLAALLVLSCSPALAAGKVDVTADIAIFQDYLRDENQELGRLEDAGRGAAAGENGCAAGNEAAAIVDGYKKSMLLAAGVQDLLVSYVFVETGLSQMHPYIWTRLNRMRLLAFSYLTDGRDALSLLEKNGPRDALPIFERALARIEAVHDSIKALEARFAPLAGTAPATP